MVEASRSLGPFAGEDLDLSTGVPPEAARMV